MDYEGLCKLAKDIHIDGKPSIENALVRAKLANFYCAEAGLRATNYRAISSISQGKQPGPETSIGKMMAGQNIQDTSAFFLDLMEQTGIVYDESVREVGEPSEVYLSIPALRIAGGTDEIQANVIAESVLGLPGEVRVDKNIPFNEIPVSK